MFALGQPRTPANPITRPGEIARGDYWSIVREGEDYVLRYLSRGLLGREERLLLHEREANAIASGDTPIEQFLPPID